MIDGKESTGSRMEFFFDPTSTNSLMLAMSGIDEVT